MRESQEVENIDSYWIRKESSSQKCFLVNKSQDTTSDGLTRIVPCTCHLYDSDSDNSFIESDSDLRECQCFHEKSKYINAISTGNLELLDYCLEHDINIDAEDEYGNTLLHIASDNNDAYMLKIILDKNFIPVDAKNYDGLTPLSMAIRTKNEDAALLLLDYGANPNVADNNDKTPLMYAVMTRNMNLALILIKNGAEVNEIDVFDNTPLSLALFEEPYPELVENLMSSGANPLLPTRRLNSFLEHSKSTKHLYYRPGISLELMRRYHRLSVNSF